MDNPYGAILWNNDEATKESSNYGVPNQAKEPTNQRFNMGGFLHTKVSTTRDNTCLKGRGMLSPNLWQITLVLLCYWWRVVSIHCKCSLCLLYTKETFSFKSCHRYCCELMWCMRRSPPQSGLFILFSLIFKVWSTYSYICMVSGYLVHNTLPLWELRLETLSPSHIKKLNFTQSLNKFWCHNWWYQKYLILST